jgi:hypothetical protein
MNTFATRLQEVLQDAEAFEGLGCRPKHVACGREHQPYTVARGAAHIGLIGDRVRTERVRRPGSDSEINETTDLRPTLLLTAGSAGATVVTPMIGVPSWPRRR